MNEPTEEEKALWNKFIHTSYGDTVKIYKDGKLIMELTSEEEEPKEKDDGL